MTAVLLMSDLGQHADFWPAYHAHRDHGPDAFGGWAGFIDVLVEIAKALEIGAGATPGAWDALDWYETSDEASRAIIAALRGDDPLIAAEIARAAIVARVAAIAAQDAGRKARDPQSLTRFEYMGMTSEEIAEINTTWNAAQEAPTTPQVFWLWEDGFDRFGFGDGDGEIMTDSVVEVLEVAGYRPTVYRDGVHNEYIVSMTGPGGAELVDLPRAHGETARSFLPLTVVALLSAAFPVHSSMEAFR